MPFINILLPVYNEELRIENGVRGTVKYLAGIGYQDYEITILDNASIDRTPELGKALANEYNEVHYLRLEEKGVGVALRKGAACNECPVVGYMDIDLSTDISNLQKVIKAFSDDNSVDLVNGSRLACGSVMQGRKWYRNITSYGLVLLLKLTLGLKASDAICGFKFFAKDSLNRLIRKSGTENGWFFVIELLLRAERYKYNIVELPVNWQDDLRTTVQVTKLIQNYLANIRLLRKRFRQEGIL